MAFLISLTVDCVAQSSRDTITGQTSEPNPHDNSSFSWTLLVTPAVSFLGGGVIAGLINLWNNARLDRKRRRAEFLDSQLRNLYGPLQFLASCSQNIYGHAWKIGQAYDQEYGGENSLKHSGRSEEMQATLDVNNEYFELVNANRRRMVEILTNHYALTEPDDAEVFSGFLIDSVRRDTEFNKPAGLKLPREVYKRVGDICSLRPEFVKLVDRRFREKRVELKRLSG